MTVDPRLAAAIEIEREANALLARAERRLDEDVNEAARMKRVARRLREEAMEAREMAEAEPYVGAHIRPSRARKAA